MLINLQTKVTKKCTHFIFEEILLMYIWLCPKYNFRYNLIFEIIFNRLRFNINFTNEKFKNRSWMTFLLNAADRWQTQPEI